MSEELLCGGIVFILKLWIDCAIALKKGLPLLLDVLRLSMYEGQAYLLLLLLLHW